MLNPLRKLHPLTHVALAAFALFFIWMNLEYSRTLYTEKQTHGWSGGMRFGCPCALLDSGTHYFKIDPQGKEILLARHYTRPIYLGLFVDLFCLVAGCILIGIFSQKIVARINVKSDRDVRAGTLLTIHGFTYALALAIALGAVWLNMRISTDIVEAPTGINYHQQMGFPLVVFTASDPKLDGHRHLSSSDVLARLREHPEWWYRRNHWHFNHIAINILCGVLLVGLAAFCSEQFFLRRAETDLTQQPMQPAP